MPVRCLNILTPLTFCAFSKLTLKIKLLRKCIRPPPRQGRNKRWVPKYSGLQIFDQKGDCLQSTLFIKNFTLTSRGSMFISWRTFSACSENNGVFHHSIVCSWDVDNRVAGRSLRCAHGQCYLAVVRESTENGVEANFRHGTNGTPFKSRYFSWLYHNQNSAMAVNRHVRRGVTRISGKLPNMDKVQVAFWRILGWMLRLRWRKSHFSYYGVLSWISGKKASKWSSKTEKGRRLSHRSAVYLNQSEKVVKIRSVT